MDWFVYRLLSEKQKKWLASLFSEKQKNRLKQITKHGKRHAQRERVQTIKHHLYDLGFTTKGLEALKQLHATTDDEPYLKRLTAWELALWYANQYTKEGAQKALEYLDAAKDKEKDRDQLRRITIIEAECYERLDQIAEGKKVIDHQLAMQQHPDLFLARANLEATMAQRLPWINRAFGVYNLQPITFHASDGPVTYDDLRTEAFDEQIVDGPKVSVILPAYNAQSGIQIAIESILTQTWRNIELIVVDDCSTDRTKEVIEQYVEQDSRVKLFSTPQNSGPYVARNIALQEATGEYVTVNDADDWSHAEKIATQVQYLIDYPTVIANTSEHARLTEEDLKLYRRGTPGKYIFPNMSSLMFRRKPVVEKLGYWDSVRFAADGEFKRRLIKVFGKNHIVDLETGPLSLPRQSVSSLTGSSAFGYNGFFMGARKEYVESLECFHAQADTLYYPFPQEARPFPVPEPMWPRREDKPSGRRHFDIVIAADFRNLDKNEAIVDEITTLKEVKQRIGLMQMNDYDRALTDDIDLHVRQLIDGINTHMLVYGEKITTDVLLIPNHHVLRVWQKYLPDVDANHLYVHVQKGLHQVEDLRNCLQQTKDYFGKTGIWYPTDDRIREQIVAHEIDELHVANENWGSTVRHVSHE